MNSHCVVIFLITCIHFYGSRKLRNCAVIVEKPSIHGEIQNIAPLTLTFVNLSQETSELEVIDLKRWGVQQSHLVRYHHIPMSELRLYTNKKRNGREISNSQDRKTRAPHLRTICHVVRQNSATKTFHQDAGRPRRQVPNYYYYHQPRLSLSSFSSSANFNVDPTGLTNIAQGINALHNLLHRVGERLEVAIEHSLTKNPEIQNNFQFGIDVHRNKEVIPQNVHEFPNRNQDYETTTEHVPPKQDLSDTSDSQIVMYIDNFPVIHLRKNDIR